jgi:hypothetical protein
MGDAPPATRFSPRKDPLLTAVVLDSVCPLHHPAPEHRTPECPLSPVSRGFNHCFTADVHRAPISRSSVRANLPLPPADPETGRSAEPRGHTRSTQPLLLVALAPSAPIVATPLVPGAQATPVRNPSAQSEPAPHEDSRLLAVIGRQLHPCPLRAAHLRRSRILHGAPGIGVLRCTRVVDRCVRRLASGGYAAAGGRSRSEGWIDALHATVA